MNKYEFQRTEYLKKLKFIKDGQKMWEAGQKRHTCRPLKPQPVYYKDLITHKDIDGYVSEKIFARYFMKHVQCPYGCQGETIPLYDETGRSIFGYSKIFYRVSKIQSITNDEIKQEGIISGDFILFIDLWKYLYPKTWHLNEWCWFISLGEQHG